MNGENFGEKGGVSTGIGRGEYFKRRAKAEYFYMCRFPYLAIWVNKNQPLAVRPFGTDLR